MTVPATTWKRSNGAFSLVAVFLLLIFGSGADGLLRALAAEATGSRLPTIRQVAIMPVYWQGSFPEAHRFVQTRKHIESFFPSLVRASKRFVFSNDVLTADLWGSPEGRRQLVEDYEIDAMFNLTISGQGDLMLWTVRLLHPSMRNYLTETERMSFNWLLAATDSELDQRLQNLLFRLLNRYPVDVYVTSIQGRYLTLSSGTEQNIFEGDDLSFYQTAVRTQHPVDGSWLSFEQKLLGKAKIIESKNHSSIAMITALSYTDAIRVGDGARVEAIATRRPFQQKPGDNPLYVPVTPDSPLVEPWPMAQGRESKSRRYGDDTSSRPAVPVPPVEVPAAPPRLAQADRELPSSSTPDVDPAQNSEAESDEKLSDILPITFKEIRFRGEHERFSISRSAKASSQFPAWILNRVDLAAVQDLSPEMLGILHAHFRFGSTKKGSYFGFGLGFEPLYPLGLRSGMMPSLDRLLIGGLMSFESLAVSGEPLGGWDAFSFSPTVHVQGSTHYVDQVQTYDYDLAARLTPITFGEVGVKGKKRKIDDGMQIEFEGNVIRRMKVEEWEWGAMFAMQNGSWKLSKGSIDSSSFRIGLAGRMRF